MDGFSSVAGDQEMVEGPGPSSRFVGWWDVITEGFEVGAGGLEVQAGPWGKGLWWVEMQLGHREVPSPLKSHPLGCPSPSSPPTGVVAGCSKAEGSSRNPLE